MKTPLLHRIVTRPPQIAEQILRDLKYPLIFFSSVFVGFVLYEWLIIFLYIHLTHSPMFDLRIFYEIGHAAFLHSINASWASQAYQLLLAVIAKLKLTPLQVHLAEAFYIGVRVAKLLLFAGVVLCVALGILCAFKRRNRATQ